MNKAAEAHEALKNIGEIMFFHHEGYATNIRGTEEFKLIEKYIDDIESQNEELKKGNKYYQELPVKLADELNFHKKLAKKTMDIIIFDIVSKYSVCPYSGTGNFRCNDFEISCEQCWKEYIFKEARNDNK